jgi:hypothetical protein
MARNPCLIFSTFLTELTAITHGYEKPVDHVDREAEKSNRLNDEYYDRSTGGHPWQ